MPGMEKQDEEHAVAFPTITSVPELICSNEPDETFFPLPIIVHCKVQTSKTIGYVDLQLNVTKKRREGHGEIAFRF